MIKKKTKQHNIVYIKKKFVHWSIVHGLKLFQVYFKDVNKNYLFPYMTKFINIKSLLLPKTS